MAREGVNVCDFPTTLVRSRKSNPSDTERFSLLLLEFGEVYFEDFSAVYFPDAPTEQESVERKQRGRLKICSQSILFDSLDFSHPVLKIALRDCIQISPLNKTSNSEIGQNSFNVKASQYCEILEGNVIGPYRFKKALCSFVFRLNYGSVENVLSQVLTLFNATKQLKSDQLSLIDSLVSSRHNAVSFNTSWLEDLYEEVILDLTGDHVTPMVSNPGRVMLTSSRLYYQPYNNVGPEPVLKVPLSDLLCVLKRRYMLRHTGVELFRHGGNSMFLVLPSVKERNSLYDRILSLRPSVNCSDEELERLTHCWQVGELSNYDYLMMLNHFADRSFNDIMQYPVMPWIIADYSSPVLDLSDSKTFRDLSKPVGALNPERLAFFKERYSEMSGRKFLYGTHYSAPGYVLYFLVRAAPEYLLCLQNGNFDKPNRLFHSVTQTWANVNGDHADVKELIPEFYQPSGDFLMNTMNVDLGVRSDGVRVSNVKLPPWAMDASDFTKKCCEALESDFVSKNIHLWIDLIFGYKQRGREAIDADNLFHYLTYEGEFDIDRVQDPNEVAAIELQVKEFGQTPRQLFVQPHPVRLTGRPTIVQEESSALKTVGNTTEGLGSVEAQCSDSNQDDWVNVEMPSKVVNEPLLSGQPTLTLLTMQKIHREPISGVALSHDGDTLFSVSHDKTLKVHTLSGGGDMLRSAGISNLPLSCLAVLPGSKCVLVGSWDNYVYIYSVEYAAVVCSTYCHDSSITSLVWRNGVLVTGSWDSTVKVWQLQYPPPDGQTKPESPAIICELDHDNEVSCVDVNSEGSHVVSGTVDGYVTVWNVDNGCRDLELQAHSEEVNAVQFSPDGTRLCTCGGDGVVRILDLATHAEIISRRIAQRFHCALWKGELILLGTDAGAIIIWNAEKLTDITMAIGHTDAVTGVCMSEDGKVVASSSRDKCVATWSLS